MRSLRSLVVLPLRSLRSRMPVGCSLGRAKGKPVLIYKSKYQHVPLPLSPSTPLPMKRPRFSHGRAVARPRGVGRAVRARIAPPWVFLRLPVCENICDRLACGWLRGAHKKYGGRVLCAVRLLRTQDPKQVWPPALA